MEDITNRTQGLVNTVIMQVNGEEDIPVDNNAGRVHDNAAKPQVLVCAASDNVKDSVGSAVQRSAASVAQSMRS